MGFRKQSKQEYQHKLKKLKVGRRIGWVGTTAEVAPRGRLTLAL